MKELNVSLQLAVEGCQPIFKRMWQKFQVKMWIELIVTGAVIRGKSTPAADEKGKPLRYDLFVSWQTILESEYDEVVEQANRLAHLFEKKLTEKRLGLTAGRMSAVSPKPSESTSIHS